MARKLRIKYEHALCHVINRGTYRADIFATEAATLAFLLPFGPKAEASPADVIRAFEKFIAQTDPHMQVEDLTEPKPDQASARFTGMSSGQAIEGRCCALLAAGGSMAFVVGVAAPSGKFTDNLPVLQQVAEGFGFYPPTIGWTKYRSPAGGFTMQQPEGWHTESSDGRTPKDNVDWVAFDP